MGRTSEAVHLCSSDGVPGTMYCRRLPGRGIACELQRAACSKFHMHRTDKRPMCVSCCNRRLRMRSPWQRESQCRQPPRQAQHLQPRQAPQLQMVHLQLQQQQILRPMPRLRAPNLPRSTTRAQTTKSEECSKCLQWGKPAEAGAVAASRPPAAPSAAAAAPAMAVLMLSAPTPGPLTQTRSVQQWLLAAQAAPRQRRCLPWLCGRRLHPGFSERSISLNSVYARAQLAPYSRLCGAPQSESYSMSKQDAGLSLTSMPLQAPLTNIQNNDQDTGWHSLAEYCQQRLENLEQRIAGCSSWVFGHQFCGFSIAFMHALDYLLWGTCYSPTAHPGHTMLTRKPSPTALSAT